MSDSFTSENELAKAIEMAAGVAIKDLFAQHPGHYYYLSLITTGEAHSPVLAAWSEEALEQAVKDEGDKNDARWGLKWSYADSPFYCFGDDHFKHVKELFAKRPNIGSLHDERRKVEFDLRIRAMELAMSSLDQKGFFGTGEEREKIVVNVEVMPPDYTNTLRALRLNPAIATRTWLKEAAEPAN